MIQDIDLLCIKKQDCRTYMHPVYKWQQNGKLVCILRMDNASESKKLQKRCEGADWELRIEVKYIAKDLQHNHFIWCGFASNGTVAMSNENLPLEIRHHLARNAL